MYNKDYDEFLEELNIFLNDKNIVKEGISKDNNLVEERTINIEDFKDMDYKDLQNNSLSIKNLPDEEKPREKLLKYGASKLTEYELIAILLGSGSRKENVLSLSQKLWTFISKYRSISELNINDLLEIEGIGISKASSIMSAIELSKRINTKERLEYFSVNSPKSVADIFMSILRDEMVEHFYVLLLDTKNKIITWDEISKGDLNSSIVHPREVYKFALKWSANSIICLHNHPSGDVSPSVQDIDITNRLEEVGNLVGIKLLDHIIIGYNRFLSLREYGIINRGKR